MRMLNDSIMERNCIIIVSQDQQNSEISSTIEKLQRDSSLIFDNEFPDLRI